MQYNTIDGLLRGGQDERQVVGAVSELWQFPSIVRLFHLSSEGGWEKLHLYFYIDLWAFSALPLRLANWEVLELGVGSMEVYFGYLWSWGGKYTTWKC